MSLFGNHADLLGMNQRNADYILKHNPREYYPFVDDKLKTKAKMEEYGLPNAVTYLTINHAYQIPQLRKLRRYREFAIKPARGAEGRGIVLITDRSDTHWITSGGVHLSQDDIEYHVTNILAGLYSLGGTDDACFIEYYIHSHPVFKKIIARGVPDIRIVLYQGVPVMSMLRLPTEQSDGKANLHQGAIGAGVDIITGTTLSGVHKNRYIDTHPDTDAPIGGFEIPFWDDILEISARTYEIFKLGYIGVDFVIDVLLGPLILEVNARPGLNIQLANHCGLLKRLNAVDAAKPRPKNLTPKQRVDLAKHIVKTTQA
jgi:alpha-L-glutamate ligase-like protein